MNSTDSEMDTCTDTEVSSQISDAAMGDAAFVT